MAQTPEHQLPPLVQVYDYSEVRHYKKRYSGAIISSERIVRSDTIAQELVMNIKCDRIPTKVVFNGVDITEAFKKLLS